MAEQKILEQRFREARSSQEIADLQAEPAVAIQHIEGSPALALPVMRARTIFVRSTREGECLFRCKGTERLPANC